jgi:pyridoxamine 5'-phosphate oxidase
MEELHQLRLDYKKGVLEPEHLPDDPLRAFEFWFEEARQVCQEPNAMTLATADAQGRPSARMVLLKGVDSGGFIFFTNYLSRKGRQIDENPHAALVFYWEVLERQVRIEGTLSRLSPSENDAYFNSRPYGSQLGAWASMQSHEIADRAEMEQKLKVLEETYPEGSVPRPPHWGGFHLMPLYIEFWQGRSNRLHDRLLFEKTDEHWKRSRLAP